MWDILLAVNTLSSWTHQFLPLNSQKRIQMERYVIREKVGSGNFAKVYLATDVYTKEEVSTAS